MAYKIGQVIKLVTAQQATAYSDGTQEASNIITDLIYPYYGIRYLNNFGIQARPGALFSIEGEEIVIGRSGCYEINNDLIQVSDLRMLSEGTFVIDFKY